MTVQAESNTISYSGTGAISEFDFPFKIFSASDLQVIYEDNFGNSYILPSGVYSYSVSGELDKFDNGGTVNLLEDDGEDMVAWNLPSGYTLTISLNLPYSQPTDLVYGGSYRSEVIELMVDRVVKMVQQLSAVVDAMEGGGDGGGGASPGAWGGPTAVNIAGGVLALVGEGYYSINTEGLEATDDLDKITGLVNGDVIIIKAASESNSVVVKHGSYIRLTGGSDFTLNSVYDRMMLQCIGSDMCVELSRASGG